MTLGSDCSRPALPRWCWLRVCFLSSYKALRKHPEPVWNACSRSTRGSMRNMPFFLHTMITTPEKLNKQLLFPHMTHNQIGKPFVSGKLWPCAVRSDSGQGQTRKTDVAEDKSRELWQTEVAPGGVQSRRTLAPRMQARLSGTDIGRWRWGWLTVKQQLVLW